MTGQTNKKGEGQLRHLRQPYNQSSKHTGNQDSGFFFFKPRDTLSVSSTVYCGRMFCYPVIHEIFALSGPDWGLTAAKAVVFLKDAKDACFCRFHRWNVPKNLFCPKNTFFCFNTTVHTRQRSKKMCVVRSTRPAIAQSKRLCSGLKWNKPMKLGWNEKPAVIKRLPPGVMLSYQTLCGKIVLFWFAFFSTEKPFWRVFTESREHLSQCAPLSSNVPVGPCVQCHHSRY